MFTKKNNQRKNAINNIPSIIHYAVPALKNKDINNEVTY